MLTSAIPLVLISSEASEAKISGNISSPGEVGNRSSVEYINIGKMAKLGQNKKGSKGNTTPGKFQ